MTTQDGAASVSSDAEAEKILERQRLLEDLCTRLREEGKFTLIFIPHDPSKENFIMVDGNLMRPDFDLEFLLRLVFAAQEERRARV